MAKMGLYLYQVFISGNPVSNLLDWQAANDLMWEWRLKGYQADMKQIAV